MAAAGSVPEGTKVGRYHIVSLLGKGGMGEVYAARDEHLGRQVALKILPSHRTSDPERVARFVREAQASSALNHPAIVSVHDAGSEGNVHFLAMELIDGEPLSEWIRSRRASTARAVELMAQVAEGLDRAHANGIIHRDLKPENVMVSRDGYAKIVDFGVAKLTERTNGRRGHTGVTTPTSRIGTTAYMSPEQVEGRPLDHRADAFAFGVVLYEVLTGSNPFASEQYADTLHNIVHLEPPLDPIPPPLRRVVRRCLRKEPDQRYASMQDAALDLREALADLTPARSPSRRIPRILLPVALLLAAAAAWLMVQQRVPGAVPEMRMTRLTNVGTVTTAAISPDARYIAYAAEEAEAEALYVKQIATGTVTRAADPDAVNYFNLSVSPDSNYLYYVQSSRAEPNVAHIFQRPLLGGPARRIAADTEFWFALSPDGNRVAFRRFNALDREYRLTLAHVDGGNEEVLLRRKHPEFLEAPVWTAEGDAILYFAGKRGDRPSMGVHQYTLATRDIQRIPSPSWPSIGAYAPLPDGSGHVLTAYDRQQPPQIWFLPRGETTGRKVTSDISAYYSLSVTADSKSLAAVRDSSDSNIFTLTLNRPGAGVELRAVTFGVGNLVGGGAVRWVGNEEILYTAMEKGRPTVFIVSAGGGEPQRLIHSMPAWQPSVSLDRRIAFLSDRGGPYQVWLTDAAGENIRPVPGTAGTATRPVITDDGKSLIYIDSQSQFAWRLPLDGDGEPEQLTEIPTNQASLSPDRQWVLCRLRSTEPNVPLWRTAIIPANGGAPARFFFAPRYGGPPMLQWHPDGGSFLYVDWKGGVANVWEQPIDGSEPRQLTSFESGKIYQFGISPDGTQLALSRGEPSRDAVLIQNFR